MLLNMLLVDIKRSKHPKMSILNQLNNRTTIRDGSSTALLTVDTVDTVNTVRHCSTLFDRKDQLRAEMPFGK